MTKLTKEIRGVIELRREVKKSTLISGRVTGEGDIQKVRQFCFAVYAKRGEIEPHLLNEKGVLGPDKDPYVSHSVYFVVRKKQGGQIVAASRLILPTPDGGPETLQVDMFDLSKTTQKLIRSFEPKEIAEPAMFAKALDAPSSATVYLIREMLHYSQENGIRQWLIALNPHIEATYRRRFGPALRRLGNKVSSKVDLDGRRPINVPYLMDVDNALHNLEYGDFLYRVIVAPIMRRFMKANPQVQIVRLKPKPSE